MPALRISIDAAKPNKLFYFVVNVVVFRESDGRCLILKRDERESVHPRKYALPGGKLEWEDLDFTHPSHVDGDVVSFEYAIRDLVLRETKEETGLIVDGDNLTYSHSTVFVRPDGIPVVLLKFAVRYRSGDVVLESGAFTGYAWVNAEEVRQYDCIRGVLDDVLAAIALFKRP